MDKINTRIQQAIEGRVFPGCVIATLHHGKKEIRPFGTLIYQSTDTVTKSTIYDLASITKSIPLASLSALLISQGKLALADRVKEHVPELQNDFDATIEDLLRYRVQGVRMSTLRTKTFEEIRAHALEAGFHAPPGESVYTNLPAFILGIVIERVGGASLERLAYQYLFEPLRMTETTFFPARDLCAPTEIENPQVRLVGSDGVVQGVPHDESARVFARARRTVGHAGLFSTAPDVLKFAEHLVSEPNNPIAVAAQQGLGWQVHDENFMGAHVSERAFGKTGFTGTSIVIDSAQQAALVILSNRTYPERPVDDSAIYAFRREAADSFFGAL